MDSVADRQLSKAASSDASALVSVIVVTYESGRFLTELWPSLKREASALSHVELFIVDNASTDNTREIASRIVREAEAAPDVFLHVELIANDLNVGFGRANNQALVRATGNYVLLLNPDTVLEEGALARAIDYAEQHAEIGILGARILLPDGRLDAPCRRSFKTPGIYFYKLTGLSRLFPKSRRFGRYYLSYLDETQATDVDAVIGAFLVIRREVIDQIGRLDERFFMYCEDEDWCFRAKSAGWRVVYFPGSVVWHRKGASARTRRVRMALEWHRSIFMFHRKNLAARYPAWLNGLIYVGMATSVAATVLRTGASVLMNAARGSRE